jgi:hypothetical protein
MDMAKKERLISVISWGYISATVHTQNSTILSLLLSPPTPKQQARAALDYSSQFQRAISEGLSSEEEAMVTLTSLGSWNPKKESEIVGLQKDIHTIRRGLLDFLFDTSKLERARSLLRRAEQALVDRLNIKHNLLKNTAEAHATICQQRSLIGYITENENGDLFWPTKMDFDEFDDIGVVIQLCELFFRQSRISTELIRELARSQQWRVYWEISKGTGDLFENPTISWSVNQRELAYWSTIYDSVYNSYERPSKDVITDDDLLDSWFIRQGEKIEGKTQKVPVSHPNKPGANETFIMADKEGSKQVYKMNDQASRIKLKARQKVLQREKIVKEQNMPDSQRDMKQQLANMQTQRIKKDIGRK